MTDTTNLPPDNSAVLRDIADGLDTSNRSRSMMARLTNSNIRSIDGLKDSFVGFVTPMTRLRSSLVRMDETNRKMLGMGTTYSKLETSLRKNSDVLDKNLVSNRALIAEIAKNYEQGVRINNGALTDLTKEMIATGQNTALQRKMNADQVLQTGNNTNAVQQINKTNKDVSDKYGISNDRLIESLNSLKGVMDDASFFGPQAVTSFKNIATELKGRAGGANIEGGLQALFKVLGPGSEGLAASRLLGAGGLRQKVAGGGAVSTEDLAPIFANLERIIGSSEGEFGAEIAAARMGLGKAQMVQLKQLNDIMKSSFALSEEDQASQDEKFNTLKNLQDKQNDWYDSGAVLMLTLLGTISTGTAILAGQAALGGGAGASIFGVGKKVLSGPAIPKTGKVNAAQGAALFDRAQGRLGPRTMTGVLGGNIFGKGQTPGSRMGGAMARGGVGLGVGMGINAIGNAAGVDSSYTAMGAGIGMTIGGPWGILIGGIAGGVADIATYAMKSSEADDERVKQEKEKADRERAVEQSKDIQRINFLTGYLRSRAGASLMENEEYIALAERTANAAEEAARRAGGRPGQGLSIAKNGV